MSSTCNITQAANALRVVRRYGHYTWPHKASIARMLVRYAHGMPVEGG